MTKMTVFPDGMGKYQAEMPFQSATIIAIGDSAEEAAYNLLTWAADLCEHMATFKREKQAEEKRKTFRSVT